MRASTGGPNERGRKRLPLALAAALAAATAGCGTQYASSDPVFPGDSSDRHPIALVTAPTSLEVFPSNGGLDARTVANLRAFAERYRSFGSGRIVIFAPSAQPPGASAVGAIRRVLVAAGARQVGQTSYAPAPGEDPAPVKVAFVALKAEVATPCGNWPDDLASGSSLEGWRNEPYANFGCASQAVLAAQVADPRDFVEPRALGPSDVAMRTRTIAAVRSGKDPGTDWKVDLTPIGGSAP